MDWETCEVTTAVVHYVLTTRDEDEPELLLTDTEIELDAGLKRYFGDKIATRVMAKSLEVVTDSERDQTAPTAVAEILADPGTLVDPSKRIAIHLDAIQSKVNSSGLLGVVDGAPCAAMIKLERERGVRFAIGTVDGTWSPRTVPRQLSATGPGSRLRVAGLNLRGGM